MENKVILADNLKVLLDIPAESFDLIYIDPPFSTGKVQRKTTLKTEQNQLGSRIGFQDKLYTSVPQSTYEFPDIFDDYMEFLRPRLDQAYRVLAPHGSMFLHMDYRNVHYAKVLMDKIFGKSSFINEIIWAFDYGARSKSRWACKHQTILWYAKDPKHYTFNYDKIERVPYMAPGMVSEAKRERGKAVTSVWWHTIVPTNGKEKTGYPTQKPLGLLKRIVEMHSKPQDSVLDYFCGSGTTGEAAALLGRSFTLIDNNPTALEIMKKRLAQYNPTFTEAL